VKVWQSRVATLEKAIGGLAFVRFLTCCLLILVSTISAGVVDWHVLSEGGVKTTSQTCVISGSIGQTAVGWISADSSRVHQGYWQRFYLCGDCNGDEVINISDAVHLIAYIFSGGPPPWPYAAGDVNCDGTVNISDAVYLIAYIFIDGPVPCAECGY
jgi:hypothetical protein